MTCKVLPTLYKMGSTGVILQWTVEAHCNSDGKGGNGFTVTHGQKDGKLQASFTEVKSGKNIGKKHETTKWQQTLLEAESHWNKQKDRKGYSIEIPTSKPFLPMLAKSYDKDGTKIKFPCFWQPKLDGLRCLAQEVNGKIQLTSRQGKKFTSLTHVEEALLPILKGTNIVLDGELYIHHEEFQTIISAVKRDKPSKDSSKVQYHVYDLVNEDQTFKERFETLWTLIPQRGNPKKRTVDLVWTKILDASGDVNVIHDEQAARGFEGIMLRNVNGKYKINGRSSDLQKVKNFQDAEFEIVDAEENKGKMKGQCSFLCATEEGTIFKVKPQGNEAIRKQYWEDFKDGKLTGKLLTVKYFSMTTSNNPVPRFPVGIAIRDYD